MKLDCRQLDKLYEPYVDGLLSRRQRAYMDAHLFACEQCRHQLALTRRIKMNMGGAMKAALGRPTQTHAQVAAMQDRLARRIAQSPAVRFGRSSFATAMVTLMLMTSVVVGAAQLGIIQILFPQPVFPVIKLDSSPTPDVFTKPTPASTAAPQPTVASLPTRPPDKPRQQDVTIIQTPMVIFTPATMGSTYLPPQVVDEPPPQGPQKSRPQNNNPQPARPSNPLPAPPSQTSAPVNRAPGGSTQPSVPSQPNQPPVSVPQATWTTRPAYTPPPTWTPGTTPPPTFAHVPPPPTETDTYTPEPRTPAPTRTRTHTPAPLPTVTFTTTPYETTPLPTWTPRPTRTPIPTLTSTPTETFTEVPTATYTWTPSPTATPPL